MLTSLSNIIYRYFQLLEKKKSCCTLKQSVPLHWYPHFSRGVSLYTEVSSFQGVLISGGWNRGVPLYTEVSSFQGVGIEGFHCIQRCPHFRELE